MNPDAKKCPATHLTTDFGAPVVDNRDSLTAGARGPLLAQDVWLNEKLANFVREIIPERRMHAKGSGAFGSFTVTRPVRVSRRTGPQVNSLLAWPVERRSSARIRESSSLSANGLTP